MSSVHWLALQCCQQCPVNGLCYCRRVRVFKFQSGKLRRTYDESLAAANELQRGESEMYHLEAIDFGRRLAGEKELLADPQAPQANAIFDESGNFIIYATLLGIKVSAFELLSYVIASVHGQCFCSCASHSRFSLHSCR